MANIEKDRFLGVRWRSVWAALGGPWQHASHWFWVRWLTPSLPVSLIDADGGKTLWSVPLQGDMSRLQGQGDAKQLAVKLPQSLVLHKRVVLPQLEVMELKRAIELEATTSSPFPAADLCWGYRASRAVSGEPVHAELVLASRKQVAEYLEGRGTLSSHAKHAPEVWAVSEVMPTQYVVVQGFGEVHRLLRHRLQRTLHLGALALAMVMLGLIAITPTVQLRARAIEAVTAYDDLHARSGNAVMSREALVRSSERVQQVQNLLQETVDPVQILNLLTQVLGDDTSLTALYVKGRKVTLEGQTTNAAELMQQLSKQPGFQDVVAPVPATRLFGGNKDGFKIEFMLDTSHTAMPVKAAP